MFVDALSRMPKTTCAVSQNPLKLFSATSTPLLDLDILLAHQKRDPALLKAIMYHKGHISPTDAPPFCQQTHLFQDLVCKFIPSSTGRKRVILVPKPLRSILLYLVHDECGHSSAPYTLKRLQENWFSANLATHAQRASLLISTTDFPLSKWSQQLENLVTDCILIFSACRAQQTVM